MIKPTLCYEQNPGTAELTTMPSSNPTNSDPKRVTVNPEKIIMVGPCRASIFRNLVMVNGKEVEIPKVVFEIRYKDKSGRWRGTQGITVREIPKAILALQKAFEYLQE